MLQKVPLGTLQCAVLWKKERAPVFFIPLTAAAGRFAQLPIS